MSKENSENYDGFEREVPKEIYPVAKWISINGKDIFFESAYLYETGVTLIFLQKPVEDESAFQFIEGNTFESVYLQQYARNPEELPTPVFDAVINGFRAWEGSVVIFNFENSDHFFPGLKNTVLRNEAIPAELRSGNVSVTKTDLIYSETIDRIEKIEFSEPLSSYKNHLIQKDFTLDYDSANVRIDYGIDTQNSFFVVDKLEAGNLKSVFLNDDEYISSYNEEGRILESIEENIRHMDCNSTYLVMSLSRPEKYRTLNFYLREHLESPVVHDTECVTLHGFGYKNSPTDDGLYKTTWIFNETKGINPKDAKKQYDICLFSATDSFETEVKTFFSLDIPKPDARRHENGY